MEISSAPLPSIVSEDEVVLEERHSAPSNLLSLARNEAPPFKSAEPQVKPKLLIWTFMDMNMTDEIFEIAQVGNCELKKALECLAVQKNFVSNADISEKKFLSCLLLEAFCYGEMLKFDGKKMSALLAIYANSHKFFKSYYWLPPSALWAYFKDIMIRHTIEDSPDGQEIFEPEESCDIVSHFHTVYLRNLPLIHIRTFHAHRLKLSWPF